MIKALVQALYAVAGSVLVAIALLLCALLAAVIVMVLGCKTALLGPRGFPWNLLKDVRKSA